jgi:16S rRNA (cytidine1402-2'-O)-methyltransferase
MYPKTDRSDAQRDRGERFSPPEKIGEKQDGGAEVERHRQHKKHGGHGGLSSQLVRKNRSLCNGRIISMDQEGSQPKTAGQDDDERTRSAAPGTLYVVSTPLGDPDDMTVRAIRTLNTVSVIASEDPAATQALLAHHHITGTVTSYGPRNLDGKIALLLDRLKKGHDVALVSDCGTPVIYDPGCRLIDAAHRAEIPVRSVPGPSALTAAMSVSGCSGDAILFEGHLPRTKHRLQTFLTALLNERRTLVFFVLSHALRDALIAIAKVFPTRHVTLAQDLTKSGEMILQGTPITLFRNMSRMHNEAEVTVVIEGASTKGRSKQRRKETRPPTQRHPSG